jgi:hypothetical protein
MKWTLYLTLVAMATILAASAAVASSPLLTGYEAEARKIDPSFKGADAGRGRAFYLLEHTHGDGSRLSCASCHGVDPRASGKTRANKVIAPMAASANPQRFTDPAKVEKWFTRNCRDVGTDHGLTKCPVPQFELLGGKVIGANALRQNVSLSANGHFV